MQRSSCLKSNTFIVLYHFCQIIYTSINCPCMQTKQYHCFCSCQLIQKEEEKKKGEATIILANIDYCPFSHIVDGQIIVSLQDKVSESPNLAIPARCIGCHGSIREHSCANLLMKVYGAPPSATHAPLCVYLE